MGKMWLVTRGFVLILFLISTGAVADYYEAVGGPQLSVSSVDSHLEIGRVSAVWIELENSGEVTGLKPKRAPETEDEVMLAMLEKEMEMEASEAIGIEAKLVSKGAGVEVASGPQLAGSLKSGEISERPLEFLVKVGEDASAGIYPMTLELNYEMQKSVQVKGNPVYPEIYFQRDGSENTIPIEVSVVVGPRIEVEGIKGKPTPGRDSMIGVVLANSGDEPALDLRASLLFHPQFGLSEETVEMGDLEPGRSKKAEFPIEVEGDLDPGDYALVCQIQYLSGEEEREEKRAVLLEIEKPAGLKALLVIPVLAILITALYLSGAFKRLPKMKRRKKW